MYLTVPYVDEQALSLSYLSDKIDRLDSVSAIPHFLYLPFRHDNA